MEKNFKRKYRERDEITKMKIANSLRNRSKSASHRQAISQGLKNFYKSLPSIKNNENNMKELPSKKISFHQ